MPEQAGARIVFMPAPRQATLKCPVAGVTGTFGFDESQLLH
jgi:hypothetical protein